MSNIDKQRRAAVRTLEAMGYVFRDEWIAPVPTRKPWSKTVFAATSAERRLTSRFRTSMAGGAHREGPLGGVRL